MTNTLKSIVLSGQNLRNQTFSKLLIEYHTAVAANWIQSDCGGFLRPRVGKNYRRERSPGTRVGARPSAAQIRAKTSLRWAVRSFATAGNLTAASQYRRRNMDEEPGVKLALPKCGREEIRKFTINK